jgi:hypothetical protein
MKIKLSTLMLGLLLISVLAATLHFFDQDPLIVSVDCGNDRWILIHGDPEDRDSYSPMFSAKIGNLTLNEKYSTPIFYHRIEPLDQSLFSSRIEKNGNLVAVLYGNVHLVALYDFDSLQALPTPESDIIRDLDADILQRVFPDLVDPG